MNIKRVIGILILIAGIAMIFISNYITTQVEEGKLQISQGQQQVDTTNTLFSLDPRTKEVGHVFTDSGQGRINAGEREVIKYEQMASWLQIGGIVLIIVGVGVIGISFIGRKKRDKR